MKRRTRARDRKSDTGRVARAGRIRQLRRQRPRLTRGDSRLLRGLGVAP